MATSRRCLTLVAFASLAHQVHGEALSVTEQTWDKEVKERVAKGQFVFAKFFAPWCGHCKRMKPDWDKLGEKYNYKTNGMLIDVDCTEDASKKLCETYGVSGYPTLKSFGPELDEKGESYEGGREYKDLAAFMKSNSKKPCVPETGENCNKKDKAFLEEIKDVDLEKLKEQRDAFKKELDELKQKQTAEQELFEQQKDTAMATQKRADELKKKLSKLQGKNAYKLHILKEKLQPGEAKAAPKAEEL